MKNLEELKKKYEELGKEIERLENQSDVNWRAGLNEMYFYINEYGDIYYEFENDSEFDDNAYKTGNYFKTEEQAEKILEKIKIYVKLKRVAEKLNNGQKIDWNNNEQKKYYISFFEGNKKLYSTYMYNTKDIGQIYCLDEDFLEKAKQEIGEENLLKLFKE